MAQKMQTSPPSGFRYQTGILSTEEERHLLDAVRVLPLKEFEFHGFTARRRVIYYGWQYDSGTSKLKEAEPVPAFLHDLRERAASFAELDSKDLALVQVIEYSPGSAIGWHRDRNVFGDIIGVSLLSPCNFRFRRKIGSAWERYALTTEQRSIYVLRGAARHEWQHSIPAVETLRYSIIFRSLSASD